MGKLETLTTGIEQGRDMGERIKELGAQELEEARMFKSSLVRVDIVDEDTLEIVDEASKEAQEVANEQVDVNVTQPMEGLDNTFSEIIDEADDSAQREAQNAETVNEGAPDFESVETQAKGEFKERAEQFSEKEKTAQEIIDEFKEKAAQMKQEMESMF